MKALKWIGIVLGVLVVLIVVAYGTVYMISESRFDQTFDIQPQAVAIPTDEASLAEGERLFISRGCSDCHGENLAGNIFINDPAPGVLAGANVILAKAGIQGSEASNPVPELFLKRGRKLLFTFSFSQLPINCNLSLLFDEKDSLSRPPTIILIDLDLNAW